MREQTKPAVMWRPDVGVYVFRRPDGSERVLARHTVLGERALASVGRLCRAAREKPGQWVEWRD